MERMTTKQILVAFVGILIIGTAGYWYLEGWTLLDSFFMTVITVTTVGYREIGGPLSDWGKIFTIGIILGGFGIAGIGLSYITSAILRGELNNFWGNFRMRKEIEKLKDHYIIAGYGRTGQVIANSFRVKNIPFVIIDNDPAFFKSLNGAATMQNENILYLIGDACEEDVLKKAGIERAKGLITVVSSDANNAFCIMSARELNPHLHIVARAVEIQNVKKLKAAGANKVVAPYILGGNRIAHSIFHPHAADFIDIVEDAKAAHIEMVDLFIDKSHPLCGHRVDDPLFRNLNLIVLGVRKSQGDLHFNPSIDTTLVAEDHLILMGPQDSLSRIINKSVE